MGGLSGSALFLFPSAHPVLLKAINVSSHMAQGKIKGKTSTSTAPKGPLFLSRVSEKA
jgi:hypothetical protein